MWEGLVYFDAINTLNNMSGNLGLYEAREMQLSFTCFYFKKCTSNLRVFILFSSWNPSPTQKTTLLSPAKMNKNIK